MAFLSLQRTLRVPTGAVATGATASFAATWPKPFANTSYSIAATVYDPAGALSSVVITAKTATGCTVSVKNGTLAASSASAAVELTATHD